MLTVSDKPVMDDDGERCFPSSRSAMRATCGTPGSSGNRAYVDYKTNGRVGYIYVLITGVDGQNDLFRQFSTGRRPRTGSSSTNAGTAAVRSRPASSS
ncbi:MAG: hypothetical protein R3B46_03915 [Phycisphaerales bacterium]